MVDFGERNFVIFNLECVNIKCCKSWMMCDRFELRFLFTVVYLIRSIYRMLLYLGKIVRKKIIIREKMKILKKQRIDTY